MLLIEEIFQCGIKKENGWNAETVQRGEKLHNCRNLGLKPVETLRDWCVSRETLGRIIPIQASIAANPGIGQDIK